MLLELKPSPKNTFPVSAFLIPSKSVLVWMKELQRLEISLEEIVLYAVPDLVANTIWGCLVVCENETIIARIDKFEFCQCIENRFFIPQYSVLQPSLNKEEINKLFTQNVHLFHPSIGIVDLESPITISDLLNQATQKQAVIFTPEKSVYKPSQINSFQVKPVPAEEFIKNMEEKAFPKAEKMPDKPLSLFEKAKLAFYKSLFNDKNKKENTDLNPTSNPSPHSKSDSSANSNSQTKSYKAQKPSILDKIKSFLGSKLDKDDKMKKDFEDLEKRNQKQIERLLNLLKENPDEALKYAIPLDSNSSNRGEKNSSLLDMSQRWFDFSFLEKYSSKGGTNNGGSIDLGDQFDVLEKQYNKTAEDLIKKNEINKAAFIYLKLLKNDFKAAQTLENGKLYQGAASIYLKNLNNKQKAAECYEKGKMTTEAIDLYKDLNQFEKVGDLYYSIHKKKEAHLFYQKVVDNYKSINQYVKGSLIYKDKMNDFEASQDLLKEGWLNEKDALTCLKNYFNNIPNLTDLQKEMNMIYTHEITNRNRETFLQVVKNEFSKNNELNAELKEMAYELIATQIEINPSIVQELKFYNQNDKLLPKDTMRFRK